MGNKFAWQIDEAEWDEGQEEEPAAQRVPWFQFLVLLLLLVAVFAIYQQRQERIMTSIPPPDQLIEVVCRAVEPGTTATYWYDPRREQWLDGPPLFEGPGGTQVTALDDNSFLVEETSYDQGGTYWRLSLWEDGIHYLLEESGIRQQRTLAATDPSRRKLVFSETAPSSGLSRFYLLDLDACLSGGCELVPLPGPVIWSPDGRRTLISSLSQSQLALYLGDVAASPGHYLGAGFALAWIDDEHFVYHPAEQSDSSEMQWLVGNIAGDVLAFLNSADVANLFPPDSRVISRRWFTQVEPNPAEPGELLVTISGEDSQGSQQAGMILRYNWRTGEHERLLVTPAPSPVSRISPDGRWLAVYERRSSDLPLEAKLILFDLVTGKKQAIDQDDVIPLRDIWSADGRWLLSLHPNLLYLIVPDDDHQQLVLLPTGACQRARWIPND